jgi:PDZ domain-containing protein
MAVALGYIPTPYWIIAPGSAVDLSKAVAVDGHAPPTDRFLLTDVTVQHATALTLVAGLLPGFRLVRQDTLIPRDVPVRVYDRVLADAMNESQDVAAVVAERAAGLRVADPPNHVYVGDILPASNAAKALRAGDEVISVGTRRITEPSQILGVVGPLAPGVAVPIAVRRGRTVMELQVRTMHLSQGTRLGIALETRAERPSLPVPVRFSLDNISGSSGGLMFALAIYSALRGDRRHEGTSIAGTGTIASDGSVGPIEGTLQKLIAAKRAGARIFLVPRENAAEIASERDVRIVPVGSFREALAALPG